MISVIDQPPNSGWEARRWEGASRVRMVGRGWRPHTFAKPHQCACPSAQKGARRLLLRCRRPPASIDASISSCPSELVQIARQSPPDCRRHSFLNSGMRRCLVWAWGTSIIGSSRAIGSIDVLSTTWAHVVFWIENSLDRILRKSS